ncbi:hypothetical protein EU524_00685 [Candidatus Thorarchaeota archaeon]|nr:MAG: hypothetical protein EU524_00685 [Candidatus Thorarchaeota archaeon]
MDLFGYSRWKVEFQGDVPGPDGEFTVYFQDRQVFFDEISDGFLMTKFVDDIMKQVDEQSHYDKIGTIQKITDPTSEDSTKAGRIIALLGTHKKVGKMGVLLGYNEADVWETLGLYPEQYARAVKSDKGYFDTYIAYFAMKPEEWEAVHLLE